MLKVWSESTASEASHWNGALNQLLDALEFIDPPCHLDEFAESSLGKRSRRLIPELVVQLIVRHRAVDVAEGLLPSSCQAG